MTAAGDKFPVGKSFRLIKRRLLLKIICQILPMNWCLLRTDPLRFTIPDMKMINPIQVVFQPFYQIHDARYMMYWMALSNAQYHSYLDSLGENEKEKLELAKTHH